MPGILDFEEVCEELTEVTTTKIMNKKKFHEAGLFSEQIFGPLKNYTCQCGTYHGVSKIGDNCDLCRVDILNSDERRKRFAKIVLPIPVVNPIFYDLLVNIGGIGVKKALNKLMKDENSVLYNDGNGDFVVVSDIEAVPEGVETFEGIDAIETMIHDLSRDMAEEGRPDWKLVFDNIHKLIIRSVIVLPPDLRPAAKGISKNNQILDKINRYYTQILTKKESMRSTIIEIRRDKQLFYVYFKQLQKDVNELYQHILDKMAKKEGLIRGHILGKRIDFSGRAVIVPEPTLSLDECVLPYLMILEIFKLKIAKKLIEIGKFKLLNKAITFIDECIETQSPILFTICELIVVDKVCILNRQPSLHRLGMLGFKIKTSLDSVIKIHPLICAPFNADFDGDQMAVYIPISNRAKQEIIDKMFVTKNLHSPANGKLTTIPSQDIILGVYAITSGHIPEYTTMNKLANMSEGEILFNDCLPLNFTPIKGPVDSKRLMIILNDIKDLYHEDEVAECLDNIKKLGFKFSTVFGTTMSLDDCIFERSGELRDAIYEPENIRQQLVNFSSEKLTDELRKNFEYAYLIESGARGSWDQVKQMILTRGFISNFNGEILDTPIKHSLLEGLTEQEFFNSTYGCRKGLMDVAVNTGTSGYLSRKLIFTCANLQIDVDMEDCGTTDYLQVHIDSYQKLLMLDQRYYLEDDVLKKIDIDEYSEQAKQLIGTTILLRSPILCKNEKVCKTCYGDTYKKLHSKFIGIIAAQTLGERGTQLILRTFHTSGSAVIRGEEEEGEGSDDMRQHDIVADLSTVASLLHKFKGKTYTDITADLFKVYGKNIYHIHFECVVSQLMWNGDKKWRLYENRDALKPKFFSVQSVPSNESWILGLAFSNPKRHILKGLLNTGEYKGVIDKILLGERIG